ncbi:MAG: hypothetical protein CMJ21_03045 [Phycisphaerae bacterium]|nr:hypothetical protein [Phycisphaerae bacterium]
MPPQDQPAATITSITPMVRDPSRAVIKVGKRAVGTLSLDMIKELGLVVDQVFDEQAESQLAQAMDFDRALIQAVRRIKKRPMSKAQVHLRLRDLGYDEVTAQCVMDRLIETGLIDDDTLGQSILHQTTRSRPAGPNLIRQKLEHQSLAPDTVDQIVEQSQLESDPVEDARQLAQQRADTMGQVKPVTKMRRLWGYLTRRGYDQETIQTALSDVPDIQEQEESS